MHNDNDEFDVERSFNEFMEEYTLNLGGGHKVSACNHTYQTVIVCRKCRIRDNEDSTIRFQRKRSFLGFTKIVCPVCGSSGLDAMSPLTSGYRIAYWFIGVISLVVLFSKYSLFVTGFKINMFAILEYWPFVLFLIGAIIAIRRDHLLRRGSEDFLDHQYTINKIIYNGFQLLVNFFFVVFVFLPALFIVCGIPFLIGLSIQGEGMFRFFVGGFALIVNLVIMAFLVEFEKKIKIEKKIDNLLFNLKQWVFRHPWVYSYKKEIKSH